MLPHLRLLILIFSLEILGHRLVSYTIVVEFAQEL